MDRDASLFRWFTCRPAYIAFRLYVADAGFMAYLNYISRPRIRTRMMGYTWGGFVIATGIFFSTGVYVHARVCLIWGKYYLQRDVPQVYISQEC